MDSFFFRQYIVRTLIFIIAGVFVLKLAYLQLFDDAYRLKGLKVSNHEVIKDAPRGLIFDRNGELLVNNTSSFSLSVIPRIAEKKGFDTVLLARLLEISEVDLKERLQQAKKESRYYYKYAHVYKNLSPKVFAAIKEHLYRFPGFKIENGEARSYNYTSLSHTIGYVKEINRRELDRDKDDFYRIGDYIGKTGIEKTYEKDLRGEKGAAFFLQDHKQKIVGTYKGGAEDVPTVPGHDLKLSIDIKLQEYATKLMQNKRGAIIVIEPATGEILAKVSAPGYDLNRLYGAEGGQYYNLLNKDKINRPLFDRSVMAQYPPGSIFKLINALIGLQEGIITPYSYKKCVGGNYIGNFFLSCHHHKSPIALKESIEYSCNPYYGNLFRDLLHSPKYKSVQDCYQKWYDYVKAFGLGQKLGDDFPLQAKGNVPSIAYYNKKLKRKRWVALNIISISIGQGELMITPLQMANMVTAIANRGYYYTPHIVKEIKGGTLPQELRVKHEIPIKKKYFDEVIKGMKGVVDRKGGTGTLAAIKGIKVAGKTGTVQVKGQPDNSVFVAFAPIEKPKIALIVYVERGTWGGAYAAPIAGLLIEKYLRDSISDSKKYLEKLMIQKNLLEKVNKE